MRIPATLVMMVRAAVAPAASPGGGRPGASAAFHAIWALDAGGWVSLRKLAGSVRVIGWDRPQVEVRAINRACSTARLAQARIVVEEAPVSLAIRTERPDGEPAWSDDPARACLDGEIGDGDPRIEIRSVNGSSVMARTLEV